MVFFIVMLCLAFSIILAYQGLKKTGIVFALLWSTYAFEQVLQTSIPWFVSHGSIINVASALLVCLGVGLRGLSLKKLFAQRDPILWLYILLFTYAAISTFWSYDSRAWTRVKSALPYFIVIGVLSPLCINSWKDLEDTRKVMIVFGGLVLVAASLGTRVESHSGRSLQLAETAINSRGRQVLANPLAIASFAGSVVTFAFLYLVATKKTSERFLCLIAIFAGAVAMANSGSRGNIVAVGGSMLIGLYLLRKQLTVNGRLIAILLVLAVICVGVWKISSDDRMLQRWSAETAVEAIQGRQQSAWILVEEFRETPDRWFFGLGSSASYYVAGFYIHMIQVEILCELGIVGFSIYAAICLITFKNCFALVKMAKGSSQKTSIAVALSCCSLAVFITHAKSNTFLTTPDWYALNIVMSTMVRNQKVFGHNPGYIMRPGWAGNPPALMR